MVPGLQSNALPVSNLANAEEGAGMQKRKAITRQWRSWKPCAEVSAATRPHFQQKEWEDQGEGTGQRTC